MEVRYGNKAYDANETVKVLLTRPDGNPAIFNVSCKDDQNYVNSLVMDRGYKMGYNEDDTMYDRIYNQELNEARFQAQQKLRETKERSMRKEAKAKARAAVEAEFPKE